MNKYTWVCQKNVSRLNDSRKPLSSSHPRIKRGSWVKPRKSERISQNPEHNAISLIETGRVSLLINTATRTGRFTDEGKIRAASVRHRIPLITTLTEAQAAVQAIRAIREGKLSVAALQDYFVTTSGGGE